MIRWHERYRPEWDTDPWQYLHQGVLPFGRSRRLGSMDANSPGMKVHLGVQHFDPALWGYQGEAYCRFFASVRFSAARRAATLRTFKTMGQALAWAQAMLSGAPHA